MILKCLILFLNKIFNFFERSIEFNLFDFPRIKEILQDKSKLNTDGGVSTITPLKLFRFLNSRWASQNSDSHPLQSSGTEDLPCLAL